MVKALKGAGLLKLGSDGATPALATASVSAPAAPFSASDLKAITSKVHLLLLIAHNHEQQVLLAVLTVMQFLQ